jgi:septal ring factor EnvC (AmiA/AmiB activator)
MDRRCIYALALVVSVLAAALGAVPAGGQQSENTLRNKINSQRDREQSLSSAVAKLGALESSTERAVTIFGQRAAAVQADLDVAESKLASAVQQRDRQRRRALRLRARLRTSRARLATLLRQRYADGEPDLVTVVLNANGFKQLLETVDFVKRIQKSDQQILDTVKNARADALAQRRQLTRLSAQRQAAADIVRQRHDALAGIVSGLNQRRNALAQARAARSEALSGTRASRQRAERALTRLLAQRARQQTSSGPGGPWSIPGAIVQCESGGQNLAPNSAGASGYYQFLPDTWRGLGGSTPQAYLASKAEQDRLAAQLWANGSGARNWVCAGIVGIG